MEVEIKKVHGKAEIPEYKTMGAAGFDLSALSSVVIYPNETVIIKTGLAIKVPQGYELQIRPRSGLSVKTKLRVANSPGTIDSDYTGEIGIILENIGDTCFNVSKGDRVAQGVICPVERATFKEVKELVQTERGDGGFGSTGVKS